MQTGLYISANYTAFAKQLFVKIVLLVLSFLTPIIPLMLLVAAFILFDTLAGRWKAKKTEGIISKKTSQIISKMLLYQCTVITLYCIDYLILSQFVATFTDIQFAATKVGCLILIWVELESIDEKYQQVKGKSFWDTIKRFFRRVKEVKNQAQEVISDENQQ